MNKTKVLIVSTNADNAGAPIHVKGLVTNLDVEIYDCRIVFGSEGPIKDYLDKRGYKTYCVKYLRSKINFKNDLKSLKELSKIIREFNPQIIHAHSTKAGLLARIIGLKYNKPVVYTIHGWGWRGLSFFQKSIVFSIELITRICFRNSYICVAEYVKNQSLLTRNNSNATVIYNSAPDLYSYKKNKEDGQLNVLMPARIDRAKDHLTVIKAIPLIHDDVKITFCGKGTDSEEFKESANNVIGIKANKVNYLGDIDDMKTVYSQTDILLLSSFFEALPLSIVEGMSVGIPIIASNVGGIPELVKHNDNGLLFEVENVVQLADSINKLRNKELRTKMGEVSRQKYLSNHSEKVMVSKVSDLYTKLLNVK